MQECWALGIAEIPSPVSEFLQAMDYTLNGNQMIHYIIQDSKSAFIRSVSNNCMKIKIPHFIMDKHYFDSVSSINLPVSIQQHLD